MSIWGEILSQLKKVYQFILHDIWKITGAELSKTKRYSYNSIKVLILAIRGFKEDKLDTRASALTYYTLFAIVPILALILGIGKGFGVQDIIVDAISKQLSVQAEVMPVLLEFVDKYITRTQQGVFIGIGFTILLWSVMAGFRQVETAFNDIWQVKKPRTFVSQFATYFSIMLILPIFIVASSGLTVFASTQFSNNVFFGIFTPFVTELVRFSPYFINWIVFTALYIIVPNTRVRIGPALIAGIFTGTLFQLFQYLYIEGQVYLTSYNAVYGGFAIIPLLLLWLQISWLIILLGAELSFAVQNIKLFEFESDSQNISKRYKNFLTIVILQVIIKQFEKNKSPFSSEDISQKNSIPIRLVRTIVHQLTEVNILSEIYTEDGRTKAYQPALDINKISISYLLEKLEEEGSEGFLIDKKLKFSNTWKQLKNIKSDIQKKGGATLIKDL